MPAVSQKQQRAMAIAEHDPDKLYTRNEGLKNMGKDDLHDFASTPRKSLPQFAKKKKKGGLNNLPGGNSDNDMDDSSAMSK
jgi:hypothetical protein